MTLNDSKYDLGIVNESVSDKLKKVGEYLKKLWERFKSYIKKIYDWISKKLYNLGLKSKKSNFNKGKINIKKSFTIMIPKLDTIKFVSIKELEDITNIHPLISKTEDSIKKFIHEVNTISKDDVKKKVSEKLASALGIPTNDFYADVFDKNNILVKTEIKTIEDLKKTYYYNSLLKGECKAKSYDLVTKINHEITSNSSSGEAWFALKFNDLGAMADLGDLANGDMSKEEWLNKTALSDAIERYMVIGKLILSLYGQYYDNILTILDTETKNYAIILNNCEIENKIASSISNNNFENVGKPTHVDAYPNDIK
jgi:hypothetical protein